GRLDLAPLILAQKPQSHFGAGTNEADGVAQVRGALDRLTIHRDDDVAGLNPRLFRGRTGRDALHHRTVAHLELQRFHDVGRHVGDLHTEHAAAHFTVFDQLIHHRLRHVDRHGETDADVAARWRDDGGVDADQVAVEVDQCTTGVTGVDRG